MRRKHLLISFLTICIASILFGFTTDNKYFDIARNLDIFTTLFKEVNAYYVDEVDPEPLINEGINSMLSSLDPYTNFIPEEDVDSYRAMTTGQYGGIGVVVGTIEKKAYVTMLYENFSAHKEGIKIGDEIIEVNGVAVKEKNPDEVTELLKGTPKSEVELKVVRTGSKEPIVFKIKREKITVGNVPYSGILKENIGYIFLSDFTFGAAKEVKRALNNLKDKGVEKIILDLRGNPGGLLNEAINVSNIFINKGEEIVSTKSKVEEWNKSYLALNAPVDVKIPLVVLINNASASASEIVAGVVQDYDRGVLIGRKTFGKGLVQSTRPLSYNAQLKVTTAKYYTPTGRCIQRVDYANRNNNGKAKDVPDSLKSEFKTSNGRLVYDGGGLAPDIKVDGRKMASITKELMLEGYIFKYANLFFSVNDSIETPVNFKISDEEYVKFKKWMLDQEFEYAAEVEQRLEVLQKTAEEELIYDKMKTELAELNSDIQKSKASDFEKFDNEIKLLLQKEIVSRYYLYKGDIEATIHHDHDVSKALEILMDDSKYHKILSN